MPAVNEYYASGTIRTVSLFLFGILLAKINYKTVRARLFTKLKPL
jgi:hypothetical protein